MLMSNNFSTHLFLGSQSLCKFEKSQSRLAHADKCCFYSPCKLYKVWWLLFKNIFFSWFDFSKNVWSVSNSFCCKAIFVPHFLVEYVELHICALYDLPVRRQRGSSRPFVGGVKLHFQKYVTSAAVWCIGGIFRKKAIHV